MKPASYYRRITICMFHFSIFLVPDRDYWQLWVFLCGWENYRYKSSGQGKDSNFQAKKATIFYSPHGLQAHLS